MQALIEQLEADHSDALTTYLNAMSRFENYSFGDILEIARQKPYATQVAGFWKWKELGRFVKTGEKGIRILAPIVGIRRKRTTKPAPTPPSSISLFCLASVPPMSRCVANRRGRASIDAPDQQRCWRQPRPSRFFYRTAGHRACLLYRPNRARAWHELQRTYRDSAGPVRGRRVQHLSA